mmetsp:Transcript_2973/g.4144  ORF Transcript_2973/g.4144 Transcript_2973/m.4144 type:complete len:374 (+) Transcript_2973:27-1148(+)
MSEAKNDFEDSEDESSEEESPQQKDDDDDEFEFGNDKGAGATGAGKAQQVQNQHFDEALSVSEDEESIDDSVSMDQSMDQQVRSQAPVGGAKQSDSDDDDSEDEGDDSEDSDENKKSPQQGQSGGDSKDGQDDDDDDDDSSSGSSSEEEESTPSGDGAKLYDPKDYAHLKVSAEIQDLFDYIGRYKPNDIELETKLQPFIPDFIPAVGEIDPFIKVPPPDGKPDDLGLVLLDEPAAHQSDPTVLDIKIRVMSKHTGLAPVKVRSIDHADKHPKKITTWINNIEEVHRKKPPPTVNYSKNMPDIESLMQVWPSEFEELLKEVPLPSSDLDMDLAEYAKIVCALLDIPVYDKITESLHVLFTLYTEFKNNAHFQQ